MFHSLNVKQWVSFSQIGVPQRSVPVSLCFQYTPIYPEYDKSCNNLHFSGQSKIIPKLRQAYFGANFFTKRHLWGLASVTSLASRGGINVPTHEELRPRQCSGARAATKYGFTWIYPMFLHVGVDKLELRD